MSFSLQTFAFSPHPKSSLWGGSIRLARPFTQIRRLLVKGLGIAGIVLLVLGILSFVVPLPNYHHHGVRVGDTHIGVTTEHNQRVPPILGGVLVIAGAGLLIAGAKS
jgi:hypothetical protein